MSLTTRHSSLPFFERPHRFRLRNFVPALFTGAPSVVVPEIEHRLAEMFDDVGAIEIDVFDQRAAILAIKNYVFVLAWRTAPLDDYSDSVRRTNRRVWDVWRNEKCFTFADQVVDDLVPFADADFDVAFELIEIFLGIDLVKIVTRVRTLDHHDEEIPPVIKIPIADRRFEFLAVLFDPIFEINRRLDGLGAVFPGRRRLGKSSHETRVFR